MGRQRSGTVKKGARLCWKPRFTRELNVSEEEQKGRIHNDDLSLNLRLFCKLPKKSENIIDTNIAHVNAKVFGLRKRL
jgi:hypothetical protein